MNNQYILTDSRLAFSVEEISTVTSLSSAFIRKEIRAGRLNARRCGRRVLVLRAELLAYLDRGQSERIQIGGKGGKQ
jgi:excisionase family DNA binding protein